MVIRVLPVEVLTTGPRRPRLKSYSFRMAQPSYCRRSLRLALRAEMIRILTRTRAWASLPIVTNRDSSVPSSGTVTARGSSKMVAASAKSTPCFLRLARAHSPMICTNVHIINYPALLNISYRSPTNSRFGRSAGSRGSRRRAHPSGRPARGERPGAAPQPGPAARPGRARAEHRQAREAGDPILDHRAALQDDEERLRRLPDHPGEGLPAVWATGAGNPRLRIRAAIRGSQPRKLR